jgi:hypothetical protein
VLFLKNKDWATLFGDFSQTRLVTLLVRRPFNCGAFQT